jgi:hypothetical protein
MEKTYVTTDVSLLPCNKKYNVSIMNRRFTMRLECTIYRPDLLTSSDLSLLDFSWTVPNICIHRVINTRYIAGFRIKSDSNYSISLVIIDTENRTIVQDYLLHNGNNNDIDSNLLLDGYDHYKEADQRKIIALRPVDGSNNEKFGLVVYCYNGQVLFFVFDPNSYALELKSTIHMTDRNRFDKLVCDSGLGYYLLCIGNQMCVVKMTSDEEGVYESFIIPSHQSVRPGCIRASFSKNYLIVLILDAIIYQFDIRSDGKLLGVFNNLDTYCNQIVVSEDERLLYLCSEIGTVYTAELNN